MGGSYGVGLPKLVGGFTLRLSIALRVQLSVHFGIRGAWRLAGVCAHCRHRRIDREWRREWGREGEREGGREEEGESGRGRGRERGAETETETEAETETGTETKWGPLVRSMASFGHQGPMPRRCGGVWAPPNDVA